jgi:hypothetical protein
MVREMMPPHAITFWVVFARDDLELGERIWSHLKKLTVDPLYGFVAIQKRECAHLLLQPSLMNLINNVQLLFRASTTIRISSTLHFLCQLSWLHD